MTETGSSDGRVLFDVDRDTRVATITLEQSSPAQLLRQTDA